jgi:hypothetical protein
VRKKKNLNEKSSEYHEENFLKENPEGLPPCVPEEVVLARVIPKIERIQFINGRDPGYPLEFHYHSKTHPLKHYTLYHGKEYDLPEEIVDHLESCAERQYGYRQGVNGHPEMYVKGLKYNFRCQKVKRAA